MVDEIPEHLPASVTCQEGHAPVIARRIGGVASGPNLKEYRLVDPTLALLGILENLITGMAAHSGAIVLVPSVNDQVAWGSDQAAVDGIVHEGAEIFRWSRDF